MILGKRAKAGYFDAFNHFKSQVIPFKVELGLVLASIKYDHSQPAVQQGLKGVDCSAELTRYTWVPQRWICTDTGHFDLHKMDPKSPQYHTDNLLMTRKNDASSHILVFGQSYSLTTLTLAAKVVVMLQVIEAIFASRASPTADTGLTVTLTSFLADM